MPAVILISVPSAESIEHTIFSHNANAPICNAQPINGTPRVTEKKTGTNYEYIINENLRAVFIGSESKITSCAFVCFDESSAAEFLAQAVTACYNFGGIAAGSACYESILADFMAARSGTNPEPSAIQGLLYKISREPFGYTFTLVRIE